MIHANKCMESSSIVAVDGSGSSGASTGEVWIHYMWDPTIAPVLTWDTSKLFLNPSVFESQPFVVQCDVVMFCVSHDDVDEEHCYTYIYNINIYIYIYMKHFLWGCLSVCLGEPGVCLSQQTLERLTSKFWVWWAGLCLAAHMCPTVTLSRFCPDFSCVVGRKAQHVGLPPRGPFCVVVYSFCLLHSFMLDLLKEREIIMYTWDSFQVTLFLHCYLFCSAGPGQWCQVCPASVVGGSVWQ